MPEGHPTGHPNPQYNLSNPKTCSLFTIRFSVAWPSAPQTQKTNKCHLKPDSGGVGVGFRIFFRYFLRNKTILYYPFLPLWPSSGSKLTFFVKNHFLKIVRRSATGKRPGLSSSSASQLSAIYLATSMPNMDSLATTELHNLAFP